VSEEDAVWERTAYYGFFAERYHWTQQQVDAQDWWYTGRLPGFASVVDEIAHERSKPK
jgi:hypothetical protein